MGLILGIANEKRGYTLTDRGTFLAIRDSITKEMQAQGEVVTPARRSRVLAFA